MILAKCSYNLINMLKDELQKKYDKYIVLQERNEEVYECYLINLCKELNLGIGLAISSIGVNPKVLVSSDKQKVFIGFDSSVFCISIPSLESKLLKLDGVFFDLFFLANGKICIIHELGAIIANQNLIREKYISTDIISEWKIDTINKVILLNELDSEETLALAYD